MHFVPINIKSRKKEFSQNTDFKIDSGKCRKPEKNYWIENSKKSTYKHFTRFIGSNDPANRKIREALQLLYVQGTV